MTREERIRNAIACKEVDRVPVNVWMHLSPFDQDPITLAEETVAYNEKYDFDFIKMMPFGMYTVQDWGAKIQFFCDKRAAIRTGSWVEKPEEYSKLEVLPATYGTWGKQLQYAQRLSKIVPKNTPYIQTIFSPLTTLRKLAGDTIFADMKTNPKELHQALAVITETTINFVKANIEAGVSGFFFATQTAQKDLMSDEEYNEFAKVYDLKVINSYCNQTWFNVVHMHGTGIIRFEEIAKEYPCNVVNWHDRNTPPTFAEARKTIDKCFLGGILEAPRHEGNVIVVDCFLKTHQTEEIKEHVHQAVDMLDGHGLIVGPGCIADPDANDNQLHAVRLAVER